MDHLWLKFVHRLEGSWSPRPQHKERYSPRSSVTSNSIHLVLCLW